jgi:hypothetical protein
MTHDRSATPRSKARSDISASRLTTRSRSPNKLMSESPGQSGHALPVRHQPLGATIRNTCDEQITSALPSRGDLRGTH